MMDTKDAPLKKNAIRQHKKLISLINQKINDAILRTYLQILLNRDGFLFESFLICPINKQKYGLMTKLLDVVERSKDNEQEELTAAIIYWCSEALKWRLVDGKLCHNGKFVFTNNVLGYGLSIQIFIMMESVLNKVISESLKDEINFRITTYEPK